MSYKVLSLKWRPQTFEDVVGQDHLTKTLINAFKKDRVAQAYILTGPRGVGKTTTARIISKTLNCSTTKNGVPCNKCNSCKEIIDGRNLDVLQSYYDCIILVQSLRSWPPNFSSYKRL